MDEPGQFLLPCPFCGGTSVGLVPIMDDLGEVVPDAFGIECALCQFDFTIGDATADEIAQSWNTRDGKVIYG